MSNECVLTEKLVKKIEGINTSLLTELGLSEYLERLTPSQSPYRYVISTMLSNAQIYTSLSLLHEEKDPKDPQIERMKRRSLEIIAQGIRILGNFSEESPVYQELQKIV